MKDELLQKCRGGFIQFDVRLGDTGHNLARLREALADLQSARPAVVVLPELWAAGFDYPGLAGHAAGNGRLLGIMKDLAARHDLYLVGSLPEEAETPDGPVIHNTLYFVGPEGVAGQIRKQQLFAPMGEADHFTPGDGPRAIRTPLGLLGGLVCFDLRFPDLARCQTADGAGLLLVSGQWPAARREHWRTLLRARAIENQIFVIGCNRCGTTDNTEFAGHSMIVAPDGTVLAEAGVDPATIVVDLDPALLARSRRLFTSVAPAPYRFHDSDKITTPAELQTVVARYKAMGRRVVFTNGCFDILHRGHVTYLEEARRQGDCLVVGLNSDASVRMLNKSPERPYNDEQSRATVLAALGCVDHVVLFQEGTPLKLITALLPDVLVKGGDWPVSKIVGAAEVAAAGGRVMSIPLVDNFSTTSLIARIRE